MNTNDVGYMYLAYIEGTGGKRRPVFVSKKDGEFVEVFKITSQYEDKSTFIQKQYYPIKEWAEIGLTKPSYIDIRSNVQLPIEKIHFDKIGELTVNDTTNLTDFIYSYERRLKEK